MRSAYNERTPKKINTSLSQQKPAQIYKNCMNILTKQSQQQISKWLIQNKITSFQIKNQKCLQVLQTSLHILQIMIVQNQSSDQFLNRIIPYFKNNKKVYQFCKCLKHFEQKDYEFQFISSIAKMQNTEPISFYLKCRMSIIDSFLNKTKKQMLTNVVADQQQWFKIVKKIFKNMREEQIIQLYTDTIKYHYLNIKKNQNQMLNGAQVLKICQIIYRNLKIKTNEGQYYTEQQKQTIHRKTEKNGDEDFDDDNISFSQRKQTQVKRLFQKNMVDGLQSEDRQLIRILSYKDNNIAKLLQKKHEKMIQLIAEDVENMRKNIQIEKNKYIQLWNQKQQILRVTENLNNLTLTYINSDTADNQDKLLKAIQNFNKKFRHSEETANQANRLRENKKNKRLIQLIQKEERQKY